MANNTNINPTTARMATLNVLRENTIKHFLDPIPCNETLRNMFDRAAVPRFKANPLAKKGGGPLFYSVSHVEKFFRSRMLPA